MAQPTARPLEELQSELTGYALKIAKGFGLQLDFSHASIEQVEKALALVHEHYVKSHDETGIRGIAIEFAAYIVTTIQRNTGEGTWQRDHPEIGEASFPFHWRGADLFPYGWCMKRIVDGDGDNVWVKYQVTVLEELKKPATR